MLSHQHKLHTASSWYPNTSWDLSFPFPHWCNRITADKHANKTNHSQTHTYICTEYGVKLWASAVYLDDLVLWFEACSLCWRVFVHSSDELARFGLLTVQVEAVALRSLLHVAETRPQATFLLLHKTAAEILDFLKSLQHAWLWVLPGTTKVLPSPWNIYGSP